MRLSHGRAAALMVLVTFLWSIAGVVTRHLEGARSFEVTFWRSAFCVLFLGAMIAWQRGGLSVLWRDLTAGGWHEKWPLYASGLCWTFMFTNFMVAMMLTSVAMVLITLAMAPLITALFSRVFLRHPLPARTWGAIAVAGAGIAWMFGQQALSGGTSLTGALVALAVPFAGASNWTLIQWLHRRHAQDPSVQEPDMLPAVLIGAIVSSLLTLPAALPFQANGHDLALLGLLGLMQLAVPCLLVIQVVRVLPAAEVSLIGLLEVIFGVLLAWVGAGEAPGPTALQGGALVIGALLVNEALALRQRSAAPA
ncbi:DMT family transporter [Ideonella sp. DXS22W]|uniref:DMT family transporter n=1 Tax=Pseudaquabacterium inlustre TaxID=2984192 RepID=A0ABU9CK67_9BURK